MTEIEHELLLDDAGDLSLVDGKLSLIDGSEALAQRLRCRLQLFRGEWFLDDSWGLPWFQSILRKTSDLVAVRSLLRAAIASIPGVKQVTRVKLSREPSTRKLSVQAQVQSDAGTADLSAGVR